MLRTLKSLILIVIICFTATGIPVYANFLFNYIISEDYVQYNVDLITHSSENYEVDITFESSHNSLPLEFDYTPLKFTLFIGNQEIKNLELEVIEKSNDPYKFSFILTPERLDLPNGNYVLEVMPNILNIKSPIDPIPINFNFNKNVKYIPAVQTVPSNRTALTLYFPDNDFNRLIPITRVIPYTNIPLRSTVNELYKGPSKSLGLPLDSPIPTVLNLNLNKDIARVYLPKDIGIYNTYSSNARIALDSFINSLTSINEVSAVQFYINWQITTDDFHGVSIDKPISKYNSPKAYVAYRTDSDRLLLYPITNTDSNFSAMDFFKILKLSTNTNLYSNRIYPPIPEDVELLDYNLTDGVLKLKFNDAFVSVINNENDLSNLMIDSLVYSYTSYPEIQSVIFTTENASTDRLNILNTPINASGLINIEQ